MKNERRESYAVSLRALRKSLSIAQSGVAARLGISEAGYRHIEAGRTRLRIDHIAPIAIALGIDVAELVANLGIGSPPPVPTIEDIKIDILKTDKLSTNDKLLLVNFLERLANNNF